MIENSLLFICCRLSSVSCRNQIDQKQNRSPPPGVPGQPDRNKSRAAPERCGLVYPPTTHRFSYQITFFVDLPDGSPYKKNAIQFLNTGYFFYGFPKLALIIL